MADLESDIKFAVTIGCGVLALLAILLWITTCCIIRRVAPTEATVIVLTNEIIVHNENKANEEQPQSPDSQVAKNELLSANLHRLHELNCNVDRNEHYSEGTQD